MAGTLLETGEAVIPQPGRLLPSDALLELFHATLELGDARPVLATLC